MRLFFGGQHGGEDKDEAEIGGVVEGGCEESAGFCQGSIVGDSGGEEVEAVAWGRRPKGDETQDSISVDQAQGGVGRMPGLFIESGARQGPRNRNRNAQCL